MLNGDPIVDCKEDAPGCWAARPENIAPGEKGIVDEEYLLDERRLFGPLDSLDETECC